MCSLFPAVWQVAELPATQSTARIPKLLLAKSASIRRFGGSYLETMMNLGLAYLALGGSASPNTTQDPRAQMLSTVGMVVIMGFLMYFIVIRPQRQRQKQLQSLLERVKPGDKILTASGIVGVVITVKDKTISIRSADTKLEILKSAVSEITEKAGDAAVQS